MANPNGAGFLRALSAYNSDLARSLSFVGPVVWLAAAQCAAAQTASVRKDFDVLIPMRDGVKLAANIFRPVAPGALPVILVRTPYGKGQELTPNYRAFVDRGYAVVIQDVRGRYKSDGIFEPMVQETPDTDDTLNWIAGQAWSNKRIGMAGGSYLGIVQWKAALLRNPYLKAIFPVVSGSDDYFDRFYSPGGAMKLGQRLEWIAENLRLPGPYKPEFKRYLYQVPLRTADQVATGRTIDFYQKALDHPAYDTYWTELSTREKLDRVHVPVFSVGGWYDNFVESDLEAFRELRSRSHIARILIGPWPHNMSVPFPGVDFGAEARVPVRRLQLEWFDYWLKKNSNAPVPEAGARIFVMGANRWRDEKQWPPSDVRYTPFYLSGKSAANTASGKGVLSQKQPPSEGPDRFTYDPHEPVPTAGGATCCNPKVIPWGPGDQQNIERRADVLVYTTPPLKRDLEVTGPIRAILYVSTSAPDTDFTAKLVDVFPAGEARILSDGILRLRYRESLAKPVLATPGQVYAITIDAGVTSNLFKKGHRIRLEVSSSNFPRFDRNPNTGRAIADEREFRKAIQVVYHDGKRPSHLLLPVMP